MASNLVPAASALLNAAFYSAVPLTLAAMGGILSERAGVVNIALEGLMLAGAFAGVAFGLHSVWLGLAASLAAGLTLGLLHAFLTQKARMNHVVSGLGINLFAAGLTTYLNRKYFADGVHIETIDKRIFLFLAFVMPFAVWFLLRQTRFGLRLRAVGENLESARMAGISPAFSRYAAVGLSGVLAGLAGAYLSLSDGGTFTNSMSAGKGYIALAAVIFGKWEPLYAAGGALFFGGCYALQTQMQILGLKIVWLGVEWTSPEILNLLPYLMTIAALLAFVGRAVPPAALGQEEKEN